MAWAHQITWIKKTHRLDAHDQIEMIGGVHANTTRWTLTQKEAIDGINSGKWSFYVSAGGRTVSAILAMSRFGNPYIKTQNDGEQPDNLLRLPQCL